MEDINLDNRDQAIAKLMIAYTSLERLMIAKGIITEAELTKATEQVIAKYAEAARKLDKEK